MSRQPRWWHPRYRAPLGRYADAPKLPLARSLGRSPRSPMPYGYDLRCCYGRLKTA